jgi:NAD+ kinase
MHRERVIVVLKRSTYDQLQLSGGFEGLSPSSIRRARAVHLRHLKSVNTVLETLQTEGFRITLVEGPEKGFKVPMTTKMVITVGGDGTLLSASHKVPSGIPILGVNSDPKTSRGYLCAAHAGDVKGVLLDKNFKSSIKKVTRLEVILDGQTLSRRVLNEALFSHACPAAQTKFILGKQRYGCSGLWVGTGAGSTGAMMSAGGVDFPPECRELQAIIREPYHAKEEPVNRFLNGKRFKLISKISDGVLYLDGPFLKFPVSYQQRVDFVISTEPLSMVLGEI